MGRRSFFFKDYVAHLILIVCAFALAGVVFCYQMSSYALHAKQTELRTTVQSLAEQSKLLEGTDSDSVSGMAAQLAGQVLSKSLNAHSSGSEQ